MKLLTRMIIGWVAVFAGGLTLAFDIGPWIFFGTLLLADLLRTRFEPRIPPKIERRRRWILLSLAIPYIGLGIWLDVPDSPTHPFHIVGVIGIAAAVAWLIRDDVRVYRQLHQHTNAA